jgi:hypothetical protein
MKRIGIDCFTEEFEKRQRLSEESRSRLSKMGIQECTVLRDQNELLTELHQLAERLEHECHQINYFGDTRFRVLAAEEEVDALYDKIRNLYREVAPSSEKVQPYENEIHFMPVPEGTPLSERARWDENRWCGIKDFSQFHPAEDELIELVKYWVKEYYRYRWFTEMECGGVSSSDIRRHIDRPEARIARIGELVGDKLVEDAVEEAKKEFEKEINDVVAFEIFKHGNQQDMTVYVQVLNSAYERKQKEHDKVVRQFIDHHDLDAKQTLLLKDLVRFIDNSELSRALTSMSDHYRKWDHNPLKEENHDLPL